MEIGKSFKGKKLNDNEVGGNFQEKNATRK